MASQEWLWRNSGRKSVRCCGKVPFAGAGMVALQTVPDRNGDTRAWFGGLARCANAHLCPVCSAAINAGRAEEVESALAKWRAQNPGGSVAFLTLTMRHRKGQALTDLWAALSYAWGRVTGGKAWVTDQATYALGGWVRVVETTHGDNGWHIHIHAALLSRRHLSDGDLVALGQQVWGRWEAGLTARGLSALQGVGVDVRRAFGTSGLAAYFTKAANAGLAAEVTRGDMKTARRGNRTPFAILSDLVAGEPVRGHDPSPSYSRDLAIWTEWEQGSRGRRVITWSGRLRDDLGMGQERTDEELARDIEEETKPETVLLVPGDDWKRLVRRPGARADVLDAMEAQGIEAVLDLLASWDISWRPPPLATWWADPDDRGDLRHRHDMNVHAVASSA